MQRKSIIITAALVAGLALGIIVGPTLRGSVASAQTQAYGQIQTTAGDLDNREKSRIINQIHTLSTSPLDII